MTTPPPLPQKSTTGLDVNLAAALAYAAGFISGIVLLVMEKDSPFVRFHAMQSTIVFLAIAAVQLMVNVVPVLGTLFTLLVLWPITLVVWLLLMFKAYQGERFKLPVAGDMAEQYTR